jgi:hypothetical protein
VYPNLTDSMIAAHLGGAGRRQQQARVRRNLERAARANPAAAHPLGPRRGRASPDLGVPLPCLILALARSPGKEERAGPPEWHSERGGWDVGPTDAPRRQPPGGQLIYPSIPLAPGGLEPP